jgi:hypothetical protein
MLRNPVATMSSRSLPTEGQRAVTTRQVWASCPPHCGYRCRRLSAAYETVCAEDRCSYNLTADLRGVSRTFVTALSVWTDQPTKVRSWRATACSASLCCAMVLNVCQIGVCAAALDGAVERERCVCEHALAPSAGGPKHGPKHLTGNDRTFRRFTVLVKLCPHFSDRALSDCRIASCDASVGVTSAASRSGYLGHSS